MREKTHEPAFRVPGRYYALVAAGLGLVLLGSVTWILLLDSRAAEATQPTDFSSIPARVSFPAPELTLRDLNGVQHSLSDYRGSVILLNLWATWCPPCRAEMPVLEAYYSQHRASGLTVVGIEDGDPAAQVSSFVAQLGLSFPILLDPTYQATEHAFKTTSLPSSFVIDRLGEVRLMWVGAISEANLEKYVTPLVRE